MPLMRAADDGVRHSVYCQAHVRAQCLHMRALTTTHSRNGNCKAQCLLHIRDRSPGLVRDRTGRINPPSQSRASSFCPMPALSPPPCPLCLPAAHHSSSSAASSSPPFLVLRHRHRPYTSVAAFHTRGDSCHHSIGATVMLL